MMEKVKLTQKQADAIERLVKDKGRVLKHHMTKDAWICSPLEALSDLSFDELAKALYIGYEVEEEFKVGDWVAPMEHDSKLPDGMIATQIVKIANNLFVYWNDINNRTIGRFRYATPEEIKAEQERRVWAGIGREVKGWKWGDVLILDVGTEFQVLSDRCEAYANAYYDSGQVKKIYPVESCISFGGEKK